jgi:outer membrane protein TolC
MNWRLALLLGALALSTQSLAQSGPAGQNPSSSNVARLSVKEAELIALKNNPTISVARLNALASEQVTREVSSSLWPQAYASLTAVDARNNSRITAGALNNPIVYTRAAGGAMVTHHGLRPYHEPGRRRSPSG